MSKPETPISLAEKRREAESARAWAKLSPRLRAIAAEAMREGFSAPAPKDGPTNDPQPAA